MMINEDDKLCKVYVGSSCANTHELAERIAGMLGVARARELSLVVLPWGEIHVFRNEWRDPTRTSDPIHGYQFKPFYLEIGDSGPDDHTPVDEYRMHLIRLLHVLHEAGFSPTSACAFEDELPF